MDALLTLSSKGQPVIPARLRQLLGLQAGDRLAFSLEPDGLHLLPQSERRSATSHELIGWVNDQGEAVPLERMDPALDANKAGP